MYLVYICAYIRKAGRHVMRVDTQTFFAGNEHIVMWRHHAQTYKHSRVPVLG